MPKGAASDFIALICTSEIQVFIAEARHVNSSRGVDETIKPGSGRGPGEAKSLQVESLIDQRRMKLGCKASPRWQGNLNFEARPQGEAACLRGWLRHRRSK